jgi:hypothetical protein
VHDEDRKQRAAILIRRLRKFKIARILREAYEQKGFYHRQMWQKCWVSAPERVSKDIREYQTENQVVLPYRGTIHDLGRAITHKR